MTLKLNDTYLKPFIAENAYSGIQSEITEAHRKLLDKTGEGSDFLGWITLPDDYDKEEFARIKAAAEKIKKSCESCCRVSRLSYVQQSQKGYARHIFLRMQH